MVRHTLKIFKVLDRFGTLCIKGLKLRSNKLNPLSANFSKWSNTLKQFVGKLAANCLSVFDHFVGLALKGLRHWQCMVSIFFQINGLTLRNLVFRLGDYLSKRNVVHQGILPLPIHAQHREVFWLLHI